MTNNNIRVGIIMGSTSDEEQMKPCGQVLRDFDIAFEARVLSAHRTPDETVEFVSTAKARGIQVIIAAAGGAAHLAGVAAAHTDLPVIGIPIESKSLKGMDSLLSTVQMPPGIPVACVAIGTMGSKNAAHLAIRIMALGDEVLTAKLKTFKEKMRTDILSSTVNL
ncbi:MAG: 5-(carboxyamino)imidazole ribonucleotide mutase [Candidatus Omnitrophota bacterium]|jgi:5-(carboxyamino)imidazole ribonucleotide mutase